MGNMLFACGICISHRHLLAQGNNFFFFFFFFDLGFTYQRWAKTGEPGEKPPVEFVYHTDIYWHKVIIFFFFFLIWVLHIKGGRKLGFPTCDPSDARTTAVRNLMD